MIAKEENTKGKKLIWIVLTIIIIGLLFFSKSLKDKVQDLFKQTEKSLQIVQNTNVVWTSNGETQDYDGIIVNSDNRSINSYNLLGNKIWSKDIGLDAPLTHFGENTIYLVDKSKGKIIALNSEGEEKWGYDARQSINKVVEKNGFLIIYTKAGEQIDQINVLDEKGALMANTIVDKGRLLSSNVSADKKNFVFTTIDLSESKVKTSLLLYTIEGELLWKKDFLDWIIYNADFIDDDMIIVSDNKLMSINMEGETLWSKDINRLKDVKIDLRQKQIHVLYERDKTYIETLGTNGKTKDKLVLDESYNHIYMNKKDIFLIGGRKLIGVNGDKIFLRYICDDEIEKISFIKGNILIFTKENFLVGKLYNKKEETNIDE